MPADASLIQPETHGARSPHFQAPRWLVPARCEAKWPHGAHRHPFQSLFHRFLRSAIFGLSSLWVSPGGKEQFLRSGWRKRERHRELDGELLPFSLAKASLTVVKQNAVMASSGPQGLSPAARILRPPLPARAHARPFFANSLRNCSFPPQGFQFIRIFVLINRKKCTKKENTGIRTHQRHRTSRPCTGLLPMPC